MKNLFKKIGLPIAIFALAFFGALQTNAMNQSKKAVVLQKGYATIDEEHPCAIEVDCWEGGGDVCQYLSFPALGKVTPTSMTCNIPLARVPQ